MASESGDESSPTNRIKFMCSYGGKILPRPSDGQLKYVGGETRVISVRRDISISELMKKVGRLAEGSMVLKFQTNSEDLDALVSVRTDEELRLMFDEFSRLGIDCASRARTYLFSSNPIVVENHGDPSDPLALEQRYIDAINGVVRPGRVTPVRAQWLGYSNSASSSPRAASPDRRSYDQLPSPTEPSLRDGYRSNRVTMHRVWSSPSLGTFNNLPPQATNLSHQQHFMKPQYHYHPSIDPGVKISYQQSPRIAQDHRNRRTNAASGCTRQEVVGVPIGHGHGGNQLYGMSPPMASSGGSNRYGWHDEYLVRSGSSSPRTVFHKETGFQ